MATARKAPARASRKGDARANTAAAAAQKDDKPAKRALNAKRAAASTKLTRTRAAAGASNSQPKAARSAKPNGAAAPESIGELQGVVREGVSRLGLYALDLPVEHRVHAGVRGVESGARV